MDEREWHVLVSTSGAVGWFWLLKYTSKVFHWVGGVAVDHLLVDIYLLELGLILGAGEYR